MLSRTPPPFPSLFDFFPVSYPFTFLPSPHISPYCCVSQPKKIAGPTKGWENGAAGHPRSPRQTPPIACRSVGRSPPQKRQVQSTTEERKERALNPRRPLECWLLIPPTPPYRRIFKPPPPSSSVAPHRSCHLHCRSRRSQRGETGGQ